jgi:superfamily II DNA or RNA helicase
MAWSSDPKLRRYVQDQQGIALRTYEVNPNLIAEHVGQEDSFRTGGYGQRQVSELLQNAVDALTMSNEAGAIEFRLVDGVLYCANQGVAFNEAGITAVCYAFLSPKRDEEIIGRFGLGFKSVLGITDSPQIFSRSVSFGFNVPGTEELFASNPAADGRLPLLRVPTPLDAEAEAEADWHLRDLMSWATTIVKVPILRDGDRIRRELLAFDTRALLFMKSVDRLTVSLDGTDGLNQAVHQRVGSVGDNQFTLHSPDGSSARWLYAERVHVPSEAARASLPETISRRSMTVAYAVPAAGQQKLGELWAWFPLQEETTARGIFNAPWQVNDDRTRLVRDSRLNGEMLDVCAELFVDVALRASTPEDPAAHLDLFPARGDESRSSADVVLSTRIPELAKRRPILPDATGTLQPPEYFVGVPDLTSESVPAEVVAAWLKIAGRDTFPHPSAFSKKDRYTRMRILLRADNSDRRGRAEVAWSTWLEEIAHRRDVLSVDAALSLYTRLTEKTKSAELEASSIIPLHGGGWGHANAAGRILIPRPGQPAPEGVDLVDDEFADDQHLRSMLIALNFKEVSQDQIAAALASAVSERWPDDEWLRFWTTLGNAGPISARDALAQIRVKGIPVKVRNAEGDWVLARETFADAPPSPALFHRIPDADLHGGRADLLEAAGAMAGGPNENYPLHLEAIFSEYKAEVEDKLREQLRANKVTAPRVDIGDMPGAGPLELFTELAGDKVAIATWTAAVLARMRHQMTIVRVAVSGGKKAEMEVASPEWWAVLRHGLVMTTLGPRRVSAVVGTALSQFGGLLPVVSTEVGYHLGAARALSDVRDAVLTSFLKRGDQIALSWSPRLTELLVECARRSRIEPPDRIPAVVDEAIIPTVRQDVVVATSDDDIEVLTSHGLPYIDGREEDATVLIDAWGLQRAADALSRSIEISDQRDESLLLDLYPSIRNRTSTPLTRVRVARCGGIVNKTSSPTGQITSRLISHRLDELILIDESLDDVKVLAEVSRHLGLGFTRDDIDSTLADDEELQRNELLERVRAAPSDAERLLLLVGVQALKDALPRGFLPAIEAKRGRQADADVAQLYLDTKSTAAVQDLREALRLKGLQVPASWRAGSEPVRKFVVSLGFPLAFAGTAEVAKPQMVQVQGQITLNPLHEFQEKLASKVRSLVVTREADGSPQRGLLFLPTGAGKTRVTVESIVRMLLVGELTGPILWIAQSKELCEQAIQTWTDVWRALGDERVIDLCRFWEAYELDESDEELQIVVATDDKLLARLRMPGRQYDWLSKPSLVVVDEAHTAGTPTYTEILRWLGLTAYNTDRPLLGLTATPYRGRSEELTKRLADRFGTRKLESLDPDDPMGQLRRERVLAEVDHEVLDGVAYVPIGSDLEDFSRMKEVTKTMLDRIGQDLDRTQTLVDDILRRDEDWPVLVFAASVASAHTIAALLRLEGGEGKAVAVDGSMRGPERRNAIERFKNGDVQVLVNCELLTQGFDAPKVRALYVARPTFSPNRYHQMIGRGLRGPANGGTERCLIVNVADTFDQFGAGLAFTEFDYLWTNQ